MVVQLPMGFYDGAAQCAVVAEVVRLVGCTSVLLGTVFVLWTGI